MGKELARSNVAPLQAHKAPEQSDAIYATAVQGMHVLNANAHAVHSLLILGTKLT